MRKRLFLFASAGLLGVLALHAQQDITLMPSENKAPSDREKAGLRGPVRSVIEEQTFASWKDSEGKAWPASERWNKIEYDRDGRLVANSSRTGSRDQRTDSLSVTRYTYTPEGKLLKRTIETDGKITCEINYDYDEHGRLKSITNSTDPTNPIALQYDAGGKKTRIAISKPVQLPPGTSAVSSSFQKLFDDDQAKGIATLDGGSTITIYDQLDRPSEVQLHDVNGTLTSRAVRTYDQQGRVIEEKMLMADPLSMMSADQQKEILASGGTAQELREKMTEFLGGSEMWSIKYEYDAKGRKTLTTRNTFNHIHDTISTMYNEQGDIAREISQNTTTGTPDGAHDETNAGETIYSYEYDTNGNWTSKKTATRPLPDGTLKDNNDPVHRTLEYY